MIRFAAALAWLRWRTLVNGVRGGLRRDSLERLSRVAALIAPAVLLALGAGLALAASVLGLAGGWLAGRGWAPAEAVTGIVRLGLLAVLLLLVLAPLARDTPRSAAEHTRLLLLPVSRAARYVADGAASLADPWVAFAVPGLLMLAAGVALAGRFAAAAPALAGALALVVLLAGLGSLVGSALAWLMRSRRRGELFTLGFLLFLGLGGLLPALLGDRVERRVRAHAREEGGGGLVDRIDRALPRWTWLVPSELFGRSLRSALDGRPAPAWLGMAALGAEAALVQALAWRAHRRLGAAAEGGGSRRQAGALNAGWPSLPLLSPRTSAVALAHARNTLRTIRGRISVLLPAPSLAVFWLVWRRNPDDIPGGALLAHGYVLLAAQLLFGLFSLVQFYCNQFAPDGPGLTLQLLSPLTELELVRGKAVGGALMLGASATLALLTSLLVAASGPPLMWAAALVAAGAAYAGFTPAAAVLSAVFPVKADLNRPSGLNPHGLALLVATPLVGLLVAPGAGLAVLGLLGLRSPGLALLLVCLWAAAVALAAARLLPPAAAVLARRRENLALAALGR